MIINEDVRAIAAKGKDLLLEDLQGFVGKDVGSGLHVMQYKIEDGYQLLVPSPETSGPLTKALLGKVIDGVMDENPIDILYYDVEKYIMDGTRELVRPLPES